MTPHSRVRSTVHTPGHTTHHTTVFKTDINVNKGGVYYMRLRRYGLVKRRSTESPENTLPTVPFRFSFFTPRKAYGIDWIPMHARNSHRHRPGSRTAHILFAATGVLQTPARGLERLRGDDTPPTPSPPPARNGSIPMPAELA